jgi:hypothetical protein
MLARIEIWVRVWCVRSARARNGWLSSAAAATTQAHKEAEAAGEATDRKAVPWSEAKASTMKLFPLKGLIVAPV